MDEDRLYFTDRKDWRVWLQENFDQKAEAWLIYPKKATGKERIPYNDAVEEALCFGWIDSIIKKYDDKHTMQRFTPRKPKSGYSQANRERLSWLMNRQMIHPDLIDEVKNVLSEPFEFPVDIMEAIKKDEKAWSNYQNFSDSYQRIRIAYIDSARNRPEEFVKRLKNFVEKTKANKLVPGYGGIEKYY